jgi:peptidoglycan/LPS O-acetylase OafA/YrhL
MNTQRLPFLDGLRVSAFALLIAYHVGMYYVSWDWHVKSVHVVPGLEAFMMLSSPWRMGLLFLIGGAACQALFAKRGLLGTWRDRSTRLLLPLLFGMAVIVPPQAYYEVLTKVPAQLPGDGGYLDFWSAYLRGGRYCRGTDCMDVPTWNHLWFLPYLWAYSLIGALLAGLLQGLTAAPRWVLPAWAWLVVPALPLVAARHLVLPHYPVTHDFTNDLYNHLQYGYLFALGWLSRTECLAGFWPQVLRWRWHGLALALAAWVLLQLYFRSGVADAPPPALRLAARTIWALMSWWALLAACGWAQVAFKRETPGLKLLSAAVFCAYVLHQTVIVLLTRALLPLNLPWGLEAVLLIALTVLACAGVYLLVHRVPGLRLLVGISAPRVPATTAP